LNTVYDAEGDQSYWRVDFLYGVGVLDHRQGIRITQPETTDHSLETEVTALKTALVGPDGDSVLSVLKDIKTNTTPS